MPEQAKAAAVRDPMGDPFGGVDVQGLLSQMTPSWTALGLVVSRDETAGKREDGSTWTTCKCVLRCAGCELVLSVRDRQVWARIPESHIPCRLSGELRTERGEKGGQVVRLVVTKVEVRG
jgi:hypothetical protein